MAERFYVNFPLTPGEVLLQGPEAHHLAGVLRAKPGDRVILFSGNGAEHPATVLGIDRKTISLSVDQPQSPERELPFRLEIACAMPKGDRGDFLVEKLTELGVARLVPLRTRRSVVHTRPDRLERTVIEACKQCGRNRLMEISALTTWEDYLQQQSPGMIAHPDLHIEPGGQATDESKLNRSSETNAITIAVGPEGGFTEEEVTAATEVGWKIITLGPRVLRVETAAIALAAHYALGSACKA